MSNVNESEQVLQIGQTTGSEFQITGSALVSLENIVVTLATGGALTAAITLDAFEGARLLTFQVIGGTPAAGNIVVAGDDIDGNAQTETLAFTMAKRNDDDRQRLCVGRVDRHAEHVHGWHGKRDRYRFR